MNSEKERKNMHKTITNNVNNTLPEAESYPVNVGNNQVNQ